MTAVLNPFLPIPEADDSWDALTVLCYWRPIKHRGAGMANAPVSRHLLEDEPAHELLVHEFVTAMHLAAQAKLPTHMDLLRYIPHLQFGSVEWSREMGNPFLEHIGRNVWLARTELVWKPGSSGIADTMASHERDEAESYEAEKAESARQDHPRVSRQA